MPDPQLIQVKKYPNRRLYDRTRSRHLTHAELYDLVVAGHTVSVTDSATGADITNLVLVQALIEHSPHKFASFPPEVFHLFVRANDQLLRSMASGWFAEMLKGFGALGGPHSGAPFAWSGWHPSAPSAEAARSAEASPPTTEVEDLESRLAELMREVERLKRRG